MENSQESSRVQSTRLQNLNEHVGKLKLGHQKREKKGEKSQKTKRETFGIKIEKRRTGKYIEKIEKNR